MKILIVEDDVNILAALKKGFKKFGYAVDTAEDGQEALDKYYCAFYDLIILDINLPKLDGIEILSEIRKDDKMIKVILLSARGEVEDKILGLDIGANDYVTKPFHFKELEARVRALLRRDFVVKDTVIACEEIRIDTALKKVFYEEDEVVLTKKEYGILEYLAMNKGRVVSSEEIIEHVWESDADIFSNAFKVHLNSLRKKLAVDIVKNVRGQGYYVE